MIPQIAHRPRDLLHDFSHHEFPITPYGPQSQPRKTQTVTPLTLRDSTTLEPTSTYAVPNGTFYGWNNVSQGRGGVGGLSYAHRAARQYNDSAEHMLRRKTPNGTLAAGYDGTPVHWSSKAPSSKHLVLHSAGSRPCQNVHDASYGTMGSKPQPRPGDVWLVEASPQNRNGHFGSTKHSLEVTTNPSWAPFPENVLNHIHMQQASTQIAYDAMQIPIALQPAYHHSPCPTASNGGGMYGPYWPDGKFEPYRPAAFREHPFAVQVPDFKNKTHRQHIQQSIGPLPNAHQQLFHIDQFQHARRPSFIMAESPPETTSDYRYQPPRIYGSSSIPTPGGPLIADGEPQNRAYPAQFKDRTLAWAHSIYVDLLAFLHHSTKEKRHSRQSPGAQHHPKNAIYPKPPRQLAAAFGAPGSSIHRMSSDGNARRAISGPAASLNMPDNSIGRWDGTRIVNEKRQQIKFAISEVPHYLSPFQATSNQPGSPLSRAKEALEMLSTLCEQSEWCWIDGMLLGGCLAYGLEEYHKALDWYSKIISLDATHIEAISNLAATLLCLNRRQEAEQNWLQAVKLRPNYFEAVEHLIGLLCGDQRGSEAVGIIDFVERSLRIPKAEDRHDYLSETSSNADRDSCGSTTVSPDTLARDYNFDTDRNYRLPLAREDDHNSPLGFGSSGFAIPGCENGRILALVHAKGNMLYALGDITSASKAFEDAVLISAGRGDKGIQGLIHSIISVLSNDGFDLLPFDAKHKQQGSQNLPPLLLPPDKALQTARLVFTKNGDLPGLRYLSGGLARRAAISTTSNSLLSLAKIFQDSMSTQSPLHRIPGMPTGVGDILALYYLSLSLQPSPSTANNVGILLASVQQPTSQSRIASGGGQTLPSIPGVVPGSGVALALAYYNYGLNLDSRHAHLYTNLGSLLKDIGQLTAAIKMYEQAVSCDSSFDIALANLANAVKDQGRTSEAIAYYRRAVESSPDFAEAVCGLANAMNSVCDWKGRGGVTLDSGRQDRWHVDEFGMIIKADLNGNGGGWMRRVVDIVSKQLNDASIWGRGVLQNQASHHMLQQLEASDCGGRWPAERTESMKNALASWSGHRWEGTRVVRLVERAIKRSMHRWYIDKYVRNIDVSPACYPRPQLPNGLSVPSAPTVLPFHTFTCPLSAKDIRMISQRNALRISCSTLKSPWLQGSVFSPPMPPRPYLNVGYVSSDFNNHPLAHLMQSVFGMHDQSRVKAFCYATTASDNSSHRQQIEREAPVFMDVSSWSTDRLVHQIVHDGIHILVNLNGYTRGARNEVFAARPAPIQMSFMGFAGTLGAEWCDYILADETAIPPDTLRPWRRNVDLEDQLLDQQSFEEEGWVYSENIIFCRDTFFCCDHAQSEPRDSPLSWEEEQSLRWNMRKELFPGLSDDAVILGNFNQLYKIEPTTFRTWLRILDKVPNAILWLLRFPDLGETNLKRTAQEWAGENVASRIWFTDVAPKHQHISRARVCDLFLDTPECNAHTTAADVLWSSTPLLTLPRYRYKMCSRMAASILKGALPRSEEGRRAAAELIAEDDDQYEECATRLASGMSYRLHPAGYGEGLGRLGELRKLLYDNRWTCALFDTRRWVRDLEAAYEEAWRKWTMGEGGDIYL